MPPPMWPRPTKPIRVLSWVVCIGRAWRERAGTSLQPAGLRWHCWPEFRTGAGPSDGDARTRHRLPDADSRAARSRRETMQHVSGGPSLERSFLLQRVQPALSGLMDGSLSTLAPIFAVVLATHRPLTAFFTGLATALGAGVSMAFSEGLSDTGDLTGRGNPIARGAITGLGTFMGGVFHTLPFLITDYHVAIVVAVVVVAVELIALAALRA